MDWRVAKSLQQLLKELNIVAPQRDKASDGAIGDERHATTDSDHNPWVQDAGKGVVTARDFTHDPANGANMHDFVAQLVKRRDPRIKYIIWDRKMWRSYAKGKLPAWSPSPYKGRNAHTHHAHVSVQSEKASYDSEASWGLTKLSATTNLGNTPIVVVPRGGSKSVKGLATQFESYQKGVQPGSRTIKEGSAGDDVKWLQKKLGVRADGFFGTITKQTVINWQIEQKLAADGVVGPLTWKSLTGPVIKNNPLKDAPLPVVGGASFARDGRTFPSRDGYPVFAQGYDNTTRRDEEWGKIFIGTSKTVSQIGCAMTAVSMALSGITGQTITPDQMATFMKNNKGFSSGGMIKSWPLMGTMVTPAVGLERLFAIKADQIDKELDAGRPIIVHVDYVTKTDGKRTGVYDGTGDHWFLITGRTPDKKGYQASDPSGGKLITLHRMQDGRLEADTATKYGTKYRTVGNAVSFSRGPAVVVANKTQVVTNKTQVVANTTQVVTTPIIKQTVNPNAVNVAKKDNEVVPKDTTKQKDLPQAPREVELAIRNAATKVGVDYGYMMAIAAQESGFKSKIPAAGKKSSAVGLYQFIKQSWLGILHLHGTKHGYVQWSTRISYSRSDKKWVVNPPEDKQKILDLRQEPVLSALMAAEFAKSNETTLKNKLRRAVGPTDLYMAHFLGPDNAAKFLAARDGGKGGQSAADMFPTAAKANTPIFYTKSSQARSLDQVYDILASKMKRADAYRAMLRS